MNENFTEYTNAFVPCTNGPDNPIVKKIQREQSKIVRILSYNYIFEFKPTHDLDFFLFFFSFFSHFSIFFFYFLSEILYEKIYLHIRYFFILLTRSPDSNPFTQFACTLTIRPLCSMLTCYSLEMTLSFSFTNGLYISQALFVHFNNAPVKAPIVEFKNAVRKQNVRSYYPLYALDLKPASSNQCLFYVQTYHMRITSNVRIRLYKLFVCKSIFPIF